MRREDPIPTDARVVLQLSSLTMRTFEDKNICPDSAQHCQESKHLSLKQQKLFRQCSQQYTPQMLLHEKKKQVALSVALGLAVVSYVIVKLWQHSSSLDSSRFCNLLLERVAQNQNLKKYKEVVIFSISSINYNHFVEKIVPLWAVPPLSRCSLPAEGKIITITNLILAVTPALTL